MAIKFSRRDSLRRNIAEQRIGTAIRRAFDPLGQDIVSSLQSRLPAHNGGKFPRGVDRGRFKRSIKHRLSGRGFRTQMRISASAKHAEYVEEGRKKGKMPPVAVIEQWTRRKGIGAKAFSIKTRRQIVAGTRRTFDTKAGKLRTRAQSLRNLQRGIAFVIARKIGRQGVPGLFFFRNLQSDYAGKISRSMTDIENHVADILNNA